MNLFYRLLFAHITLYLLVQCVVFFIQYNNNWLFNIFLPIETALLLVSADYYFNLKFARRILVSIFSFFLLIYSFDVFLWLGINTFAFHAAIVEGIAVAGVYLYIFYLQFQTKATYNWPLLLVCLGHVLYFISSIPYLSVLFYFQASHPILNRELFIYIILLLAQVRYLLLAIAFFLMRRQRYLFTQFQPLI
jgi:hypothetical protein